MEELVERFNKWVDNEVNRLETVPCLSEEIRKIYNVQAEALMDARDALFRICKDITREKRKDRGIY